MKKVPMTTAEIREMFEQDGVVVREGHFVYTGEKHGSVYINKDILLSDPLRAQTLAAIAPFATGPTTIRGVAHARLKETDRVTALATELRRLGQEVEEFPDGLRVTPRPIVPAEIQTYDDHRMAMSFAVAALRTPGIRLLDPGCVAKTFPAFFDVLDTVTP